MSCLTILLKKILVVYDIGCSTGSFLKQIANRHKSKKNAKFYGIDIVKQMITHAKKYNKIKNIEFLNKDIKKFKLKKNDFTISFYTLQFINQNYRQTMINKIYKKSQLGWSVFFLLKK